MAASGNATHVITMGFDPDLDDCVVIALREIAAGKVGLEVLNRGQA